MSFGKRLKLLREENNILQSKLAKDLNISRQSISNYEKEARFPNDESLLSKFAEYFDVSIDYLMGTTNIRKYPIYTNNKSKLKEATTTYSSNKNVALEELFKEVDSLTYKKIQALTESIRLFKQSNLL